MLDDDDGVALVHQAAQHPQQLAHVLEMQAGGGLIEDVARVPGGTFGQLGGQLHPLRLTAGQRGGGLAQPHITETHLDQGVEVTEDGGLVGEEFPGLLAGQIQHLRHRLAPEANVEGVAVIAGTLAHLAGHVDVGQEMHLDLDGAVPGAVFAAPALDVEAEPSRLVAPHLGLGGGREQLADMVEHAGIGGRVGTRGPPDGRLVNGDYLVQVVQAVDALVQARGCF